MSDWQVIAEADIDKLQDVTPPIDDIPSGSEGLVTVEIPWYVGGSVTAKLFDAAGAEQTIGQYLTPAHCEVLDVYESGGKGFVRFRVVGTPPLLVIGGIAAALIALGLTVAFVIVSIKVPDFLDPSEWGSAALKFLPLGLAAFGIVYLLTSGGKKREKRQIAQ